MTISQQSPSNNSSQQQHQGHHQQQQHVQNSNTPQPNPFAPVFPFPSASTQAPMSLPPTTFVPHLTFMEGQFTAQAIFADLQRRIKTLEAELASTRLELVRARASSQPSNNVNNQQHHQQNHQQNQNHSSQQNHQTQQPSPTQQPSHRPSNTQSNQQPSSSTQQQDDSKKAGSRYWTAEEHNRFLEGLKLFGQKDIKAISRHVGTRSATQVRTHAQKYYLRIERERAKAEQEARTPITSTDNRSGKTSRNSNLATPNVNNTSKRTSNNKVLSPDMNLKSVSNNRSHSHSTSVNGQSSSSNQHHDMPNKRSPSDATQELQTQNVTSTPPKSEPASILPSAHTSHGKEEPNLVQSNINSVVPSSFPNDSQHVSSAIFNTQPLDLIPDPLQDPLSSASFSKTNGITDNPQSNTSLPDRLDSTPNGLKEEKERVDLSPDKCNESGKIGKQHEKKTESGKRSAPQTPKRGPRKRAKKPSCAKIPSSSAGPSSRPNNQSSAAQLAQSKPPVPTSSGSVNKTLDTKWYAGEQVGSMSNLRALVRISNDDSIGGPCSSKPPTLRRTESSNSILADLSKNVGVLSRSDSFVFSKGVPRNNSILSLLSGIPTAMRDSPSTDRLFALDVTDDKILPNLKSMDAGSSSMNPLAGGSTGLGLGDRSLSFNQLQHMGLDELEDPSTVALALQDDQKWGDG